MIPPLKNGGIFAVKNNSTASEKILNHTKIFLDPKKMTFPLEKYL